MIVVHDVYTHRLKLTHKGADFLFMRVTPHISNLLVAISGEDLINSSSNSIGDCNFGLVGGAKTVSKLVVLCPVK